MSFLMKSLKYSQKIHRFHHFLRQNELKFPVGIPTACGQVYSG
jgi:hypothetical protein